MSQNFQRLMKHPHVQSAKKYGEIALKHTQKALDVAGKIIIPPPPPDEVIDHRVKKCLKTFLLPNSKLAVLWAIFHRNDREGNNCITMDDFFDKIIHYPRSGLTDAMYMLIESKSESQVHFGEFVEVICVFALFEQMELLRFFFFVLDTHKTGLVERSEVKHFIQMIWNYDLSSNVKTGLEYLESLDAGHGTFSFNEVYKMHQRYPNVFYPLFKVQIHIIQNTLGEVFWEAHKIVLLEWKADKESRELKALEKRQKAAEEANETISDGMVRARMGIVKFYMMPWKREAERAKIAKINAIEAELEQELEKLKKEGEENDE